MLPGAAATRDEPLALQARREMRWFPFASLQFLALFIFEWRRSSVDIPGVGQGLVSPGVWFHVGLSKPRGKQWVQIVEIALVPPCGNVKMQQRLCRRYGQEA